VGWGLWWGVILLEKKGCGKVESCGWGESSVESFGGEGWGVVGGGNMGSSARKKDEKY